MHPPRRDSQEPHPGIQKALTIKSLPNRRGISDFGLVTAKLKAKPDFGFRICRPSARRTTEAQRAQRETQSLFDWASWQPARAAHQHRQRQGRLPAILPARRTQLYSPPYALPAPSIPHNQPRTPFSTPTPRKVAVGAAQRGFPRAGGRGVGAGRKWSRASPCSNAARRRAKGAQRARSTTPTRACSRRGRRPRPRGRGRRPRTAGV
jgi:hypothetical protein